VPEPSSLLTLCASVLVLCCARLRTRSRG
jgi:hypothetical protein